MEVELLQRVYVGADLQRVVDTVGNRPLYDVARVHDGKLGDFMAEQQGGREAPPAESNQS